MSKDDWAKGYREGFEAGYKTAKAMGFEPQPIEYPHLNYVGCKICGRKGIDNMVCYNPNCPSRLTSGAGAIGVPSNIGVGGTSWK